MKKLLAALALTLSVSSSVSADPAEDLTNAMFKYARIAKYAFSQATTVYFSEDPKGEGCVKAIADARAAGVPGSTKLVHVIFEGMPGAISQGIGQYSITLDQAPALCDLYRHEVATAEANTAFKDAFWGLTWLDADADAQIARSENVAGLLDTAKECSATVDRLLARGADPDRELRVEIEGLTLSNMKQRVCSELEARAKVRVADRKDQEEAIEKARAAWVAKMNKIGVNGDRLDVMDRYWDGLYGAGHVPLSESQQAKASVMFRSLQDDNFIYIHKFVFKGNKLLRDETKTYSRLQYDWGDSRLYR